MAALASVYNISLWNLVPILVLLLLGIRRYPAFLSILIGTLIGAVIAIVFQPSLVYAFANDAGLSVPLADLKSIWSVMANGFSLDSGFTKIDTLFSGGGMSSMLWKEGGFTFVGDGNQATIRLAAVTEGNAGVFFDDLSVTTGGVPEPSAWVLMIGGFGAAGAALRRRRGLATA